MKQFLIDSTSTLLSAATVLGVVVFASAPARADTNDLLKGIVATIVIHEVLNGSNRGYSDGHELRTTQGQRITPRNAAGFYDTNRSCKVDVHRGHLYTTRTVYNCYGSIIEHDSWPNQ